MADQERNVLSKLLKNPLSISDAENVGTVPGILSSKTGSKLSCLLNGSEKLRQIVLNSFRISYDNDMGNLSLCMFKKIINMPVQFFLRGFNGAFLRGIIFGE